MAKSSGSMGSQLPLVLGSQSLSVAVALPVARLLRAAMVDPRHSGRRPPTEVAVLPVLTAVRLGMEIQADLVLSRMVAEGVATVVLVLVRMVALVRLTTSLARLFSMVAAVLVGAAVRARARTGLTRPTPVQQQLASLE